MTVTTESNQAVQGIYQEAGCAAAQPAFAIEHPAGQLEIISQHDRTSLECCPKEQLNYSAIIPGLPAELILPGGARFIPEDTTYRWSGLKPEAHLPGRLETHWITVLGALILLPAFIWLMMFKVIPATAQASVALLPDIVAEKTGGQTLALLDRIYMKPTTIPEPQQQAIRQRWSQVLQALNIPHENYRLNFRSWPMGANAMALANGDVILTDDIVRLMADKPEQLTAVMLHEIGHVEHQHSLQMLAQATATSMLFALILGDVEGAGEMILGAAASLTQSAFSRDMEREADAFAYTQLHKLGQKPTDFADAMSSLMKSHGRNANDNTADKPISLSDYLSSHPDIQERINAAQNWQPQR